MALYCTSLSTRFLKTVSSVLECDIQFSLSQFAVPIPFYDVVKHVRFEWLIITRSGLDVWIYWNFYYNYNQLEELTINLQPNPSSLTAKVSLHSASRSTTDCKGPSLSAITLRRGPHTENMLRTPYPRKTCLRRPTTNILYCWPGVFTDTLPSNGCPVVITHLSGNVFTGPLPSNGYVTQ
jgi:hypothetical protein